MKQFFTWLVLRAFKIKEYKEPKAQLPFVATDTFDRRRRRQSSVVNLLALMGSVLLLTGFFYPALTLDHSLSNTYSTSHIINTIGAVSLSAGVLLFIGVVGVARVRNYKNKSRLKKKTTLQKTKNYEVDSKH